MMDALTLTTDPEVQGGAMCFAGTRVPLSAVLSFYRRGWEPEEVQQEYPSLTLDALVMAFELYWDFCRGTPTDRIAALEAEVARLRELLRMFVAACPHGADVALAEAEYAARDALEGD